MGSVIVLKLWLLSKIYQIVPRLIPSWFFMLCGTPWIWDSLWDSLWVPLDVGPCVGFPVGFPLWVQPGNHMTWSGPHVTRDTHVGLVVPWYCCGWLGCLFFSVWRVHQHTPTRKKWLGASLKVWILHHCRNPEDSSGETHTFLWTYVLVMVLWKHQPTFHQWGKI